MQKARNLVSDKTVTTMEDWGRTSKGAAVKRITISPKLSEKLTTGSDAEAWTKVRSTILSYGAAIQQLWIPGFTDTGGRRKTNLGVADVVLGYSDIASYEKNPAYHGVIVGRVAGRVSNAKFTIPFELDPSISTAYKLPKNQQKKHCLHGGTTGLTFRPWDIVEVKKDSVKLKVTSADGEDGFPGNLTVYVTYRLSVNEEDQRVCLNIDYFANITDAICPINLTNHTYFNLAGHRAGPDALDRHMVCIQADKMCECDAEHIPTGRLVKVGRVDYTDLNQLTCLKEGLRKIHPPPQQGFDEYYVFRDLPIDEAKAIVIEPNSCRRLELFTDQLGVQFYTGNCLDPKTDPVGKDTYSYLPHGGLCLEAQGFPDAVNRSNFPKQFVTPTGTCYVQKTRYEFSVQKN
ncbi:Galactose mutarotase [Taenia solium]|eukprot:TsM_000654100 transcript=TsM_000654100 gene=TsM_000654100